jgi:hypothetical protein
MVVPDQPPSDRSGDEAGRRANRTAEHDIARIVHAEIDP